MNADQGSNRAELTDSELDQLLAAANEELLVHIKAVADPTSTLVAIMARTAPAAPAGGTISTASASDTRQLLDALAVGTPAAAIQRSKQAIYEGELTVEALYKELAPGLILYLRQMLQQSSGLAEDIAQDAFLSLVRKWPDVRHHRHPKAWLYTVARHFAIDTLQERSREFLREEPPDQEASGRDDPSEKYSDNTSAAVQEAIGKLQPRQREAVWLFYFHGFKQNEIATIMQIQRGAVGALLFQAGYRLAELLSREMGEGQVT
jgi:RNA polymerase sigma factor (sigma-70 family)